MLGVCAKHRRAHFQGRATYFKRFWSRSQQKLPTNSLPLPHECAQLLMISILRALVIRPNHVRNLILDCNITLQDLRKAFMGVRCSASSTPGVENLKLTIVDCPDKYYRVVLAERHLSPNNGWSTVNAHIDEIGGGGEHECQLNKRNTALSSWERLSSRHAMLRCALKHFSHVRHLYLGLRVCQSVDEMGIDFMPSFLSTGSLRSMTLSTYTSNGATFKRAMEGLNSLAAVSLRWVCFKDIEAFRSVLKILLDFLPLRRVVLVSLQPAGPKTTWTECA
jgi:hypothetical protein